MTQRKRQVDERFRVQPRPPRSRKGRGGTGFLRRVITEIGHVGPGSGARSGRGNHAGARGQIAAKIAGDRLGPRSRRVAVKTRLVVLAASSPQAVQTHLRYIARDGVTRDGEPAVAYDARHDDADLKAFEQRGRGDRHQFRFIIAPENAGELEDLQTFTRQLMARMEVDLGSRLDWVAVDHWDTDHPHTHVVLRGKHQAGHDLVIAREYISHGMRLRASELATEWLGPRTELEIRQSIAREVGQERWTSLDQALKQLSSSGVIDLSQRPGDPYQQSRQLLLLGRLQRLQEMGLAQEPSTGRWNLRHDIEATLRALGERGDIVRAMQRTFAGQPREFEVFNADSAITSVAGRIAAKGLADELRDRAYLIVDGVDGRAHYVSLPAGTDLDGLPLGGIVEAHGTVDRAADRNVAALVEDGIYQTQRHLIQLRSHAALRHDPDEIIAGHVRRLEALRRAGIVERVAEGIWRVPEDLVARGRAYNRGRPGGATIEVRSHLPVERQIRALGATWLDQQLINNQAVPGTVGFGSVVHQAREARKEFLVEQGFAERRGQRIIVMRNLLETLRARELSDTGARVAAETGLKYRPMNDDGRASGVYRRSLLLSSGRFAMLDDGVGFALVPWRPVIDKRLGETMSAVVRGANVSWMFGRQRGRSIGA